MPLNQIKPTRPSRSTSRTLLSALAAMVFSALYIAGNAPFISDAHAAAKKGKGPGYAALDEAIAIFDKGEHQKAALAFQRLVDTQANNTGILQSAQFHLGKALYELKFYQSALAVFDEISQDKTHAFYKDTLRWLGELALKLPETAGIIDKVGRYDVAELKALESSLKPEAYHHIVFLMGQHLYRQGEFEKANTLFGQLPSSSPWYVKGKFFEGIGHVRMHRAKPAISAFRRIIEVIDSGEATNLEEEDRFYDLAWLSLARVYYSAANRELTTGERQVDGRVLGNAITAWNKIDQASEYWLDAIFEESWALFLADQYSRSLGNIHTLLSPYFEKAYYPEAVVLKAVVFFSNCQMENAAAMVTTFHDRYDPVKVELEQVLTRYQDNAAFFEFMQRVRDGKADLSPKIKGLVNSAFSDRTLLRHLEYHRLLQDEEKRLQDSPKEVKDSALGSRILQDIALAKSFAIDETGNAAKGRYRRLIDELQDLQNQIDTVDLEIATYERGQLSQELQQQQLEAARSGKGKVVVDDEHQIWPFDGEYWRDELGFYRQEVASRCGR